MSAASLPRSFLDTNILVYADDKRNPAKQAKAIEIIAELMRQQAGVVSMQATFISAEPIPTYRQLFASA